MQLLRVRKNYATGLRLADYRSSYAALIRNMLTARACASRTA